MGNPWILPEIGDETYRGSEEDIGGEGQFFPLPFKEVLGRAIEIAAHAYMIAPECESPIEVQLASYLNTFLRLPLRLVAQYKFRRYRMDFAVVDDEGPRLFIECDGKAFHSTAAQIANDRAKDKAAIAAGIPLLRFTGSEIFRNPNACTEAIFAVLEGGDNG
jgi:very-short-patch-repair endonuclease